MRKVLLTADDGELITGYLPTDWSDTPLAPYAALAAADTLPDRVRALAALCQLPAEPLLEDARHYGAILRAAPWLFGALPEATAPVPHFTHLGTRYDYLGPLHKINAGQLEALYTFNAASEGKPLSAGPGLLAVLYCPAGKQQTPEVVRDAAKAMESLPVSVAWPAMAAFTRISGARALKILSVSALHAQVDNLLATLEQASQTPGGSRISFLRLRKYLFAMWIKYVRRTLPPSYN